MNRVRLDGRELTYEVRGAGEPVVLVYGALIADAFVLLLPEPALEQWSFTQVAGGQPNAGIR
jgi:hypothetical protein